MTDLHHEQTSWSGIQKISFRFLFIFFSLFILFQNNFAYPYFYQWVGKHLNTLMQAFIPWMAKNVLNISDNFGIYYNGSGDKIFDYLIVLTILIVSFAGTIVWSAVDSKRINYQALYYWLTVFIRFYVGLTLINYGFFKIFKTQFQAPGLSTLIQPYGDSSPMGLAWTFLGFSHGYNLFMGIAELMGILLLFRRTLTAGAIIALMTSANVMAVNYFYDVPVKIVSTALVLMILFLLAKDIKRLWIFFFTNISVNLPVIKPFTFPKPWMKKAGLAFKILLIGFVLVKGVQNGIKGMNSWGDYAPKPPFYGVYDVRTFVLKKDTLPPLLTDSVRWRQFILEFPGFGRVRHMNDSVDGFAVKLDTAQQSIQLTHRRDTSTWYKFSYTRAGDNEFILTGTFRHDSLRMVLNRRNDKRNFKLTGRGFRWINEYPYNR